MIYVSTRNKNIKVNASEAVLQGLAPDGGLYVPEEIPHIDAPLEELFNLSYEDLTAYVLNLMLPDLGRENICGAVREGYKNKFDIQDCVDVKRVGSKYVLELFHGPTSAFKDMALCLLPGLMTLASEFSENGKKIVILTATSGDTGKAALEGFADAKGTEIFVFYPNGGVSEIQKMQMATQEGSNVHVCAITGNFDEAQTAVKKALQNISADGCLFSSANSINIGRLAPQIAYYFRAYISLVKSGDIKLGEKINFSVPTGNFGDILAGWYAKKMGLPIAKLLCASNKNNVLTDFFKTGIYNKNREFYLTASPSMDILVSGNLERLLFYLSGQDDKYISGLMNSLNADGRFEISREMLNALREDFDWNCSTDENCFGTINNTYEKYNYLLDTHTAVAYDCALKIYKDEPCVVLSTANPYKFSPAIVKALTGEAIQGFEAMDKLQSITGINPPKALAGLKNKPIKHKDLIDAEDIEKYIISKL